MQPEITSLKIHNNCSFGRGQVARKYSEYFYWGSGGTRGTVSLFTKEWYLCGHYIYRYREGCAVITGNYPVNAVNAKTVGNERQQKGYKNSINFAILINSVFIWRDKQKLSPARQFRLILAIVRRHRPQCANPIFTRHAPFFLFRFCRWFQLPFARLQETTRDKDTEKRPAFFTCLYNFNFCLISENRREN